MGLLEGGVGAGESYGMGVQDWGGWGGAGGVGEGDVSVGTIGNIAETGVLVGEPERGRELLPGRAPVVTVGSVASVAPWRDRTRPADGWSGVRDGTAATGGQRRPWAKTVATVVPGLMAQGVPACSGHRGVITATEGNGGAAAPRVPAVPVGHRCGRRDRGGTDPNGVLVRR